MVTNDTSCPTQCTSITSLRDLRVDYPWECIAYASQNNLQHHPEWQWIDDYVASAPLFAKIVHTYRASKLGKATYQYGVQVPKTVKHARALDAANGDTLWDSSMNLEIRQLMEDFKAFTILDDDQPIPPGYKKVPYHFTYAVKVDLRQKSRLVIDGNRSPKQPKEDCFASVVSAEAVRLGFILAQINKLQCVAGDIGNAYLRAFTDEKTLH